MGTELVSGLFIVAITVAVLLGLGTVFKFIWIMQMELGRWIRDDPWMSGGVKEYFGAPIPLLKLLAIPVWIILAIISIIPLILAAFGAISLAKETVRAVKKW